MGLAEEVADAKGCGCRRVDSCLGFQKMPKGYALMLDADKMYFFWLRHDGGEGDIDWNKWRVRRGAIANSKIAASTAKSS